MRKSPRTDDDLPALPLRRRLLIIVLAIVTAVTIVLLLLNRPGDPKRGMPRAVPEAPRCGPGQSRDCVGGKADVIVVPASAASAASR
jgi:hypothetical protein